MACPQDPVIKNTNIKSSIYLALCWIPWTSHGMTKWIPAFS
ncbi:hypothetical protein [Rickettsia asembonensis]